MPFGQKKKNNSYRDEKEDRVIMNYNLQHNQLGIDTDKTCMSPLLASLSIVSRQSVLGLLLVLLTAFSGNVWGADPTYTYRLVVSKSTLVDGKKYILLVNNRTTAYNCSVSKGHLQTGVTFVPAGTSAGSAITTTTAASSIKYVTLINISGDKYKILDSNGKYITATAASSGSFSLANSDSYGWTFSGTSGMNAQYQETEKKAYCRSYNNSSFRSYSSTSSGDPIYLATGCSVTYNGNGKTSGTVPTDAYLYGEGATVTAKTNSGTLAKTGYIFSGWNTKADGTGTNITAGTGTFTISKDTVLYAKWVSACSDTYTYTVTKTNVSLQEGEDEESGNCEMFSAKYEANEGYALPSSITVTNAGEEGAGWTWDREEGELLIDNDAVTGNVSVTISGIPNKTASFSTGYGNPEVDDIEGVYIEFPDGVTPTASTDGWEFAGWASSECEWQMNAPHLYMPGDAYELSSNTTFYAVYRKETSGETAVTFTASSGSDFEDHEYYNRTWVDKTGGVDLYLDDGEYESGYYWYIEKGKSVGAYINAHRRIKSVVFAAEEDYLFDAEKGVWKDGGTSATLTTVSTTQTVTCSGKVTSIGLYSSDDTEVMFTAITVTYYNTKFFSNPVCEGYTFNYGTSDSPGWVITPFLQNTTGDTHEWKISNFTIPSTNNFYVGRDGGFMNGSNGNLGASSVSVTRAWTDAPSNSDSKWQGQMVLRPFDDSYTLGSFSTGKPTGATGTLSIHDDYSDKNLFISFTPDGYGISYGGNGYAFAETATANKWETDVVTLPNVASTTYTMGLKTATEGTYVTCAHSKAAENINAIGVTSVEGGLRKIWLYSTAASWIGSSAKMAIWDATHSKWGDNTDDHKFMTKVNDNLWYGFVPTDATSIILVRVNPANSDPAWDWGQSYDITPDPLENYYTITGTWSNSKAEYTVGTTHPATGDKGKFRMWANSTSSNWNVHWIPYYTLTYDKNGGSGTTSPTYRDSESSTLTVTTASNGFTGPTGYEFDHWDTEDDGSGDDYDAGDSYTLVSNGTLYAIWKAKTYSITLDNESPTEEGSTSVTLTYDSDDHAAITNPTKTGYTFGGWYSGDNGTGELVIDKNGDLQADVEVSDEDWTDGSGNWVHDGVVTLYAKWTANSYTVTLDNNDATSGSSQTVSATFGSAMPLKTTADGTPAVAALSRTGYTFTGWWDATSGGNQYYSYSGTPATIASARNWDKASATTLKAQWSINSYTLTWALNGGTVSVAGTGAAVDATGSPSSSVEYNAAITAPTVTRSGYTFDSWSSTPATNMPAANTTYTASWTINNYNIAVTANSHVTISATPASGDAISEGSNADVNYNKTITLNYSSLASGLNWGGWRVYKSGDKNTTVSVTGTGNGATFSLPAYDVVIEAFVYSAGIAWCDPDIEITGDVHITSYKDIFVQDTTKLVNISSSDFGSATSMKIAYLNSEDEEVATASSLFRLCYDGTSSLAAVDASSSSIDISEEDTWDEDYSIKYTPTAHAQMDTAKLQITLTKGDKTLKTLTHNLYGRSLPEEFVIAVQSKKDNNWYALPDTMTGSRGATVPTLIKVDNNTKPTKALIASSHTIYKGCARNTPAGTVQGIRMTTTGSNWLRGINSETKLYLQTTNSDANQVWYMQSSDLASYTIKHSYSDNKKIGLYQQSSVDYFGYAATPNSYAIYLLPVAAKTSELEASASEWGQHEALVTADVSSISATKVTGELDASESSKYTLSDAVATNTYYVELNDKDFANRNGETLLLKWYSSSDVLVGASLVTIPSILAASGEAEDWDDFATAPTAEDIVVLSKPITISSTYAVAKRIILDKSDDNTGKLTIDANKALVVEEKILVSDGSNFTPTKPSDIVIKSTSAGNGTLIFENDGDSATVQMYSKATTEGTHWTWQYIGVPFTSTSPLGSYYGSYMYEWPSDCSGWDVVTKNTTLNAFTGYLISYPSAGHTFSMEGKLAPTEENVVIDVPAGKDMVIGNSWTAPIQITQMDEDDFDNVEQTIYLFNTGMDNEEQEAADPDEEDRYAAGTYVTIPLNEAEDVGVTKISALQGFYVENTSGSAGSLTLSYAKHVRPTGTNTVDNGAMHAPKRTEAKERPTVLKIKASGSRYDDRLILLEREDFSTGFDNGWDGKKLDEPGAQPMLYTTRPDGTPDAVSALPELDGTVISFCAGEDNEYTLRFEYNGENGDASLNGENGENDELYLYDIVANKYAEVVSGNTYTFTTTDKEEHGRFILTRNYAPQITTDVEEPTSDSSLKGRAKKMILEQKFYIYRNGVLYDGMGRRVSE